MASYRKLAKLCCMKLSGVPSLLEYIFGVSLWILEKVFCWHIDRACISVSPIISYRHQCPLPVIFQMRLLTNPSIKFIAILPTELWILLTLTLLPYSNIYIYNFPYMHSPSHSSSRCIIHVQASTTIFTSMYL